MFQQNSQSQITYTQNQSPNYYGNQSNAPYMPLQVGAPASTTSQKPDATLRHLSDGLLGQARKKFIFKVYMILTLQLLLTVGVCYISYYVPAFYQFQENTLWMTIVLVVLMVMTEILILCVPAGRKHPISLILLIIFTLCEAYFVSMLCTYVAKDQGSLVVFVAAIMTLAIVLTLSLYAIFTPSDFSMKWGIVLVVVSSMLMLLFFSLFFPSPFLYNLYCCLGVILVGIYLVIDTQLIIGGRRFELSLDDYVVGAMLLYIDIIQIFLYILQMLSKK